MKILSTDRFGQLARTYWQPLTLSLLALLAFSQIISWGVAAVELNKVDTLIARTQSVQSNPSPQSGQPPQAEGKQEPAGQQDTPKPEMTESGNPGNPESSPGGDRSQIPPKNIFKKEEMNYVVSAIYLNKAVINGEPVEVGQPVGKAKLKEIGVSNVVIEEENGQTRTIEMFQGGGGGENSEPSMGASMVPPQIQQSGQKKSSAAMRSTNKNTGLKSMGLPPGITIKGMSAERLRSLSPEEQRKFRNSLNASDREQIRQQMRQTRNR